VIDAAVIGPESVLDTTLSGFDAAEAALEAR